MLDIKLIESYRFDYLALHHVNKILLLTLGEVQVDSLEVMRTLCTLTAGLVCYALTGRHHEAHTDDRSGPLVWEPASLNSIGPLEDGAYLCCTDFHSFVVIVQQQNYYVLHSYFQRKPLEQLHFSEETFLQLCKSNIDELFGVFDNEEVSTYISLTRLETANTIEYNLRGLRPKNIREVTFTDWFYRKYGLINRRTRTRKGARLIPSVSLGSESVA